MTHILSLPKSMTIGAVKPDQQMCGKAVPQCVQRRWLGYPRHMFG